MPVVLKLMIVGWLTTFLMIAFCALNESGKLLRIHERLGLWLETLADRRQLFPEQKPKRLRGEASKESLAQKNAFD